MHRNGRISLLGLFLGFSAALFTLGLELFNVQFDFQDKGLPAIYGTLVLEVVLGIFILVLMLVLTKSTLKEHPLRRSQAASDLLDPDAIGVLWRAAFLGWTFSVGATLIRHYSMWNSPFGLYMCILSFFHYSEYLTTSVTSPSTLSTDSFLLNHSAAYGVAAFASWLEYGIEFYFFPGMKTISWVTIFGFFICFTGEVIRKFAMLTAKENFTHLIRETKVEGHQLVTHGVFKICRHPSYAGWFWWSIGTQMLLVNPICVIAYTIASWNFFCHRITYEEAKLHSFFGDQYSNYQSRVPRSGVPLVTGYKIAE